MAGRQILQSDLLYRAYEKLEAALDALDMLDKSTKSEIRDKLIEMGTSISEIDDVAKMFEKAASDHLIHENVPLSARHMAIFPKGLPKNRSRAMPSTKREGSTMSGNTYDEDVATSAGASRLAYLARALSDEMRQFYGVSAGEPGTAADALGMTKDELVKFAETLVNIMDTEGDRWAVIGSLKNQVSVEARTDPLEVAVNLQKLAISARKPALAAAGVTGILATMMSRGFLPSAPELQDAADDLARRVNDEFPSHETCECVLGTEACCANALQDTKVTIRDPVTVKRDAAEMVHVWFGDVPITGGSPLSPKTNLGEDADLLVPQYDDSSLRDRMGPDQVESYEQGHAVVIENPGYVADEMGFDEGHMLRIDTRYKERGVPGEIVSNPITVVNDRFGHAHIFRGAVAIISDPDNPVTVDGGKESDELLQVDTDVESLRESMTADQRHEFDEGWVVVMEDPGYFNQD